jgi:hypothetical protein
MTANDTSRMPPPLSPAVQSLLAQERTPLAQPELVRARALARAREALRETDLAMLSPRAAASRGRRLLFAAAAGITLIAGVAAAFQILRRPEVAPAGSAGRSAREPRSLVAPPAVELPAVPAPEAASVPETPTVRAVVPRHRNGLPIRGEVAPEELQLLDRARQSDARADYPSVLAVLAEHERRHPNGRLSEEREVLRVKALVGLGQGSEARQAAARFHRQFPRSVLLRKIDDMLTSLP